MLYLVAHSFFNGQSKNSNLFPLPELHETQFKKKPWSSGDENVRGQNNFALMLTEELSSVGNHLERIRGH